MPVDYAKVKLECLFSASSDYSNPSVLMRPTPYELTPDEYVHSEREYTTGVTSASYVITTAYNSVTLAAVKNKDATNYVNVLWATADEGSNRTRVPPGGLLVLPELLPSGNLVIIADTAACECETLVVGT